MLRKECGRSLRVIKSRLDLLLRYLLEELQVLVLCKEIAAWGIMACAKQEVRPDYHNSSFRPSKSTYPWTKALMWYRHPQNFQNHHWSSSLLFQWWLTRTMKRLKGLWADWWRSLVEGTAPLNWQVFCLLWCMVVMNQFLLLLDPQACFSTYIF